MVGQGRRARALGYCYADGKGVEQNHALAATWYKKAAVHGNLQAMGGLGCLYHDGEGVEQENALAVAWWEKGAVGGDAHSSLGMGYMDGRFGLPKNTYCAKMYMMAAAAHGLAPAIEDLKELRACAACGTHDATRTCQGCMSKTGFGTVRYCDPQCQKAHWKAHAPDCGGLEACECHRCESDNGESGA